DRAGHRGRAGEREQVARAPGERRQPADLGQPGGPRQHGDLRRATPFRHGGEQRRHRGDRAARRRAGHRLPRSAQDQRGAAGSPSPGALQGRVLRPRPLLRPRHHRGAVAGRGGRVPQLRPRAPVLALMAPFKFRAGRTPLLVSMPHTATHVPEPLLGRMTEHAKLLPDTDWHLERLYDFLEELGASVLVATHSRYVVDLNRPPDNANLYPGQDTTPLVPLDTFHNQPLYHHGQEPRSAEIAERVTTYWKPYHSRLSQELQALKKKHGYALLWDAHSIFSVVPRFFAGTLMDLNLGTADGRSCGTGIGEGLMQKVSAYRAVLNGRFKGGYITRTYGDPANGVHAVQLELSEATYMNESFPFGFREDLTVRLRPQLRVLIEEFCRLG